MRCNQSWIHLGHTELAFLFYHSQKNSNHHDSIIVKFLLYIWSHLGGMSIHSLKSMGVQICQQDFTITISKSTTHRNKRHQHMVFGFVKMLCLSHNFHLLRRINWQWCQFDWQNKHFWCIFCINMLFGICENLRVLISGASPLRFHSGLGPYLKLYPNRLWVIWKPQNHSCL